MNPLDQRSSLVSNIAAGVLGWVSFIAVGLLTVGYTGEALPLFLAVIAGIIQVLVLRLFFIPLRMGRSLWYGSSWGFLFGLGFFFSYENLLSFLDEHFSTWLFFYLFIGTALGWYLSYFYIDDQKIQAGEKARPGNFGRDSHWYEPFIYGAVIYSVVYFEVGTSKLIYPFLVGAVVGIVSAAASHFSPDKWKLSLLPMTLVVLITGSIIGIPSGLIFWKYAEQLTFDPWIMGAFASIVTFFFTFLRGKQLARREEKLSMQ